MTSRDSERSNSPIRLERNIKKTADAILATIDFAAYYT